MLPITRNEAIFGIRRAVLALVDDDHSICEVAAKLGIFCGGFRRFSDEALVERYAWLASRAPDRPALEKLANRWQLAQQIACNAELACDVQTAAHDTCRGWDGFSDHELAGFYSELCDGEEVFVVPDLFSANPT
jgi:hypothetical protein